MFTGYLVSHVSDETDTKVDIRLDICQNILLDTKINVGYPTYPKTEHVLLFVGRPDAGGEDVVCKHGGGQPLKGKQH